MEAGVQVRWLFDGEAWRGPVELRHAAGTITRIRDGDGGPGPRFEVMVPGWVDAHVHLDLPAPDRPVRGSFVDWVGGVRAAREAAGPEVAEHNLVALLHGGTTCVGDIDAGGATRALLDRLGVLGRAYRELLGFDLDQSAALALVADATAGLDPRDGLSPHAPYSASPDLFREAFASGRPLAIHVAELEEERRLLEEGEGPLRDLLVRLGRWTGDFVVPGLSSVRYLERLGVLSPRTLCVHLQHSDDRDLALLAARGASACVCPGTIRWFDREPPPVERWLAAGLCVAIGTDSLASNEGLSMAREMALLRSMRPSLRDRSILVMATSMGGRALGIPTAGRLVEGGRFDAQAWHDAAAEDPAGLESWLVGSEPMPDAVYVHGNPVV